MVALTSTAIALAALNQSSHTSSMFTHMYWTDFLGHKIDATIDEFHVLFKLSTSLLLSEAFKASLESFLS